MIAGVKDMRFQALMPDVLHWLGIKKIDNMVSMSDMFVFFSSNFARPSLTQACVQEIQCHRTIWYTHYQTLRYTRYVCVEIVSMANVDCLLLSRPPPPT
jgi:hypothetical protein